MTARASGQDKCDDSRDSFLEAFIKAYWLCDAPPV